MSDETSFAGLSNRALLEEAARAVKDVRRATVRLIVVLAQVVKRQAYLEAGYSSPLDYCTQALLLSEDEAYPRIAAARAILDYPEVAEYLEDGSLTMSNLYLLKPYLTPQNHEQVLAEARGKTKREVQTQIGALVSHVPLFPLRFDVPVETLEKLDQARDLLAHVIPDGNGAELLARALDALIEKYEKRKYGITDRPRTTAVPEPCVGRHYPPGLRRKVFRRDGGRCTFESADGRRCTATRGLEFHHIVPHAAGGLVTLENITLRCRAHNRYEAEQYFGRPMADMIPGPSAPAVLEQAAAPEPTRSGPS